MPRAPKRKLPQQEPTWIAESRDFSMSVIKDILSNLHSDEENLTRVDRKSLIQLECLWSQKFNAKERQPESNPRPLTPPPPRKPRKKAPPKAKPKPRPEDNWHFVHASTLPDKKVVPHRICIPRLRPHWKLTYFNVFMPAYAIKRNLMDKYITWGMLDTLMAMDNESGTAFFQEFVDDVVRKNPLVQVDD